MKTSYISLFILTAGMLCSTGCLWVLPDGEVPPDLVGTQNTEKEESVPLNDAEAAMSGAIVRTLIRNGHSAESVPMAFHVTSTKQNRTFLNLLHSTGMVRIVKPDAALYLIDSYQKNGVWELRVLKKNGAVLLKKTVKYRLTP